MRIHLGVPSRARLLLASFAALALGGVGVGQQADPKTDSDPKSDRKVEPKVVDDKVAKQMLKAEKDALSSREPRIRKEAIERLAKFSNEVLVKEFGAALKDRDPQVVIAALQAIALQPGTKASSTLLKLLRNKKFTEDESLGTQLVRALGHTGWDKRGYSMLRDYFDDAPPKTKREILRTFLAQKEVQAFSLCVDNLDEPRPANVDSPSNPPASYWKAKYKVWQQLKVDVRRGLEGLAGRTFKDAAEAKEWAKTREARELKIRYKAGS